MSNTSVEILKLEKLCEQLYSANSPQQIHEANKVLEEFAVSSDCLNKCQVLLDRGIVRRGFLRNMQGYLNKSLNFKCKIKLS